MSKQSTNLLTQLQSCLNLDEMRKLLEAANVAWFTQQQASQADHQRLAEQIKQAVKEEGRL